MRSFLLLLCISSFALGEDPPIPHTVYIRGGRPIDPKDMIYRPVVGFVRKYKKFNPKTRTMEIKSSICSGTVLNRGCVLTAEHCTAGPGETNLSFEVYDAVKLEGADPVAKVTEIKVPEKRGIENDIALLRIDTVAPE